MKKYILAFIVLLPSILSYPQKWANIYGNPGTDESIREVIETYDHGYLISGGYEANNGTWLIKTDINGSIIWEKFLFWDDVVLGRTQISQDNNGNIVSAYATFGNNLGIWPLIVKLDSCGNKIWCRVFKDENFTKGWFDDVLILDNGDILALAYLDSDEEIELIFVYYIDSEGNLIWREGYASRDDYPHIRSANGDGINQYCDNYIIHGHCYYPYPTDTTHFFQRPLFIMLDSLFNEQWIIPFGVSDSIIGKGLQSISFNDTVFMGVGVRRLEEDKQNSLIMYFNDQGEELGYTQIQNETIQPGLISNQINDIARVNDTMFLASVNYGYENTIIYPWGEMLLDTAANIYNYIIRSDNTTGWSTMAKSFDNKYTIGCNWDEGNGETDIYLYKINENLEHDTLYPANYTYDSLCPYQIQSGEIDISDCLIWTNVEDIPSPNEYYESLNTVQIKAFPNPVKENQITFSYNNTEHHQDMELRCFDVFGKQVYKETVYQYQGESLVNIQNWQAGIYVALIYSAGQVVGQSKFVVQ